MKILFYSNDRDFKYNSFMNILKSLGGQYTVGFCEGTISQEDLHGFKPDVIIHNKPDIVKFPYAGSFISININESNSETSFSLKNPQSKNYIEPCCGLSMWDKKLYSDKYTSTSVYIGNPSVFRKALPLIVAREDIGFKFLCETPISVLGYSGTCKPNEAYLFYHGSKASLVMNGDDYRYRDIIMTDGNPVVYFGDDGQFIEDIERAISKKVVKQDLKEYILSEHTDYDRLITIFSEVGLKKIAGSIRELKIRKINENNAVC